MTARAKRPEKRPSRSVRAREKIQRKPRSSPAVAKTLPTHAKERESFLSALSFRAPEKIVPSAWLEHAPFAFWLIEKLRPRILVELGTHNGFSYFAFCQAIRMAELSTAAFAVDLWTGDEHAGFYGQEVYRSVEAYNFERYSDISTLMKTGFDQASQYFEDSSVDLLHIDGPHRFEDVKADFESWLPKLSDRAIVLFHDINVREREFGAHRFWAEVSRQYPGFSFVHGHGLGVLRVGKSCPSPVAALFDATANEALTTSIRNAYSRLGAAVTLTCRASEASRLQTETAHQADALRAEHKASQERIAELSEQQSRLRAEAEQAQAEAVRDKETLAQSLAAAVGERDALGAEEARLAADLRSRQQQLDELTARAEATALEAGALRSEREALRLHIVDLADDRARLQAEAEETITRLKDELARTFTMLSAERQRAAEQSDQLVEFEKRHKRTEADLAAARSHAAVDKESAERNAAIQASDLAAMNLARIEAERRAQDMVEALAVRERQEREHQSKLEAARAALARDLDRAWNEKRTLAADLERLSGEVERMRQASAESASAQEAAHAQALAEAQKAHETELEALRAQLVDAEAAHAQALAEAQKAHETELEAQRVQLVDAQAALAHATARRLSAGFLTRLVPPALRRRRLAKRLIRSGLIDAAWYSATYPDVARSGLAAAEHYLETGFCRGYRPNPFFDTHWYLEHYEDVRRSGINPLLHYLVNGYREGRDPGPAFQTDYYLATNPDVRANGMNPLLHFLRHGRYEGRLPVPPA